MFESQAHCVPLTAVGSVPLGLGELSVVNSTTNDYLCQMTRSFPTSKYATKVNHTSLITILTKTLSTIK